MAQFSYILQSMPSATAITRTRMASAGAALAIVLHSEDLSIERPRVLEKCYMMPAGQVGSGSVLNLAIMARHCASTTHSPCRTVPPKPALRPTSLEVPQALCPDLSHGMAANNHCGHSPNVCRTLTRASPKPAASTSKKATSYLGSVRLSRCCGRKLSQHLRGYVETL